MTLDKIYISVRIIMNLDKLVTMGTMKRLSLIYEIRNFANTYLEKVAKCQGNGLLRFGVLSHLLGWRWKTHPSPRLKMNIITTISHICNFDPS